MEVKEKSKKRELIKSIAIVFLVVLLVLTFFSNTIMNRSLPEVATQMVNSGTINAKIRGSGTVSPNESYEVILNQTREIRSVCVKVGDTVQQGDLLFVLGDVESQELKDAQEQLQNLNIDYQKKMLSLSKDYATEDRSIQLLQEDLEKAMAERDNNFVTPEEISFTKGDLAAAKNELSQIGLILEELNALLTDDEEYAAAKAAVAEWESEIKTLTTAIEGYEKQLDELEGTGTVDINRQIEDAQRAYNKALNTWESNWLAYKDDLGNLLAAANNYNGFVEDIDTNATEPQIIDPKHQKYIEAYLTSKNVSQSPVTDGNIENTDALQARTGNDTTPSQDELKKYQKAYDTLLADQNDVETKEKTLDRLEEDLGNMGSSDRNQRRAIQDKLDDAESDLRVAQKNLRQAESDLSKAEGDNTALKNQIKLYESNKRETDFTIETLNNQLTELEARKTAYDAALEAIDAKQRELTTALSGKDIDKKLDNLDLQAAQLQIQKQQELVDKLKTDTIGTEITANVSGTVSAINVSAGKENVSGSAMAVIDVVDRGYTIKVPVTNEQAKQVKIGDKADVTNYYWGNSVDATLEAIAPDPAKPGQGKLLVFRVTGDIDPGSNISLSIGQRSANFDTIVPKSALRSDTNGDFVLVITSKNTPLGNRYIATRADVQILAQDDTSAAVSGLSSGDFVLTTSSKPVEAGTQVRMVENP